MNELSELLNWLKSVTMDEHTQKDWMIEEKEQSWELEHKKYRAETRYLHFPEWSKIITEQAKQDVCIIRCERISNGKKYREFICLTHEKQDDHILELHIANLNTTNWQIIFCTATKEDRSYRHEKKSHIATLNELKQLFLPFLLKQNEFRLAAVTGTISLENEDISNYL